MEAARDFLEMHRRYGDQLFSYIVTGDKSWVHHSTQETKRQSMACKKPEESASKKAKVIISEGKVMAIVFWDCKGVLLVDFLPPNTTVNAARYCEVLTKLRAAIKRKSPGLLSRKELLGHDNARPHAARTTQTLLENFKWEFFTHPPYSPDLAPSDFHLFPALKLHLGGKHFANDDEVQAEAKHWLRRQDTAWYNSGIKILLQRYQKCLDRNVRKKGSLPGTRGCRLPKLELKKFDGSWLEWLGWWAQFSTIHEDSTLSIVDKFQYLVQSMKENTRASRLVKSYPITADNYPKAIAALKDRFGDRVILTEVCVRQLLGLVVNNARRKTIGIENLYDKLESYLRSLESLGITAEQNAAFLYPLVESSLPEELITVWQRSALSGYNDEGEDTPQLVDGRLGSLLKFLRREVKGEERLAYVRAGFGASSNTRSTRPNSTRLHVAEVNKPREIDLMSCLFCRGDHWLRNCQKWLAMSIQKRREVLMRQRTCFKCFRLGHHGHQCWRCVECNICKKSHNTLLHLGEHLMSSQGPSSTKENIHPKTESNAEKPDVSFAGMHVRTAVPTALLATALVRLVNHLNEEKVVRALLDQGSQSSFIHRDVLQGLSIPVSKVDAQIYGINATKGEEVKDLAQFAIRPLGNQDWELPLQALVVNKMTGLLPSRDLRLPITEKLRDIQLADPQFMKSGKIDIILGADVYGLLLLPEIREMTRPSCVHKIRS
ncbi:hypothetical protein LAZ67_3001408 [Cordylochernes scorpioides]|uniref:Uncharacterized protein n=1 Tax=Cordylochernes scorpioides TaxID=51811 RepID=A0ABY6K6Z0_9ARAC|nr:hypothetical protein LAZ67_3001408 [Cordylochernes scorpioides]